MRFPGISKLRAARPSPLFLSVKIISVEKHPQGWLVKGPQFERIFPANKSHREDAEDFAIEKAVELRPARVRSHRSDGVYSIGFTGRLCGLLRRGL